MAWLRGLPARQSSTLLIGGIEETSASFEARSAPRSYPTKPEIAQICVPRKPTELRPIAEARWLLGKRFRRARVNQVIVQRECISVGPLTP